MDKNVRVPSEVGSSRNKEKNLIQSSQTNSHSGDMVNDPSLPVNQSPAQISQVEAHENSSEQATVAATSSAQSTRARKARKNQVPKASKKKPEAYFPSDVKSLLSTGILDAVPVKYISVSGEKTSIGLIKGATYLCGCQDCNFDQALNALDFERHAGCKATKHPNQRIHFDNWKTVYGVVQELKDTPPERLFEAIENATGSDIHEDNFRTWKVLFQAASRELQRIDGEDQVSPPPSF